MLISYLSANLDAADPGDRAGGQVGSFGAETLIGRAGQPAEPARVYVLLAFPGVQLHHR